MTEREGVIKYTLAFEACALSVSAGDMAHLNEARSMMRQYALIGQSPGRYGGDGFGNLSWRHPRNTQHFFISGTQTGGLQTLRPTDIACVVGFDVEANCLSASGGTRPSSEAMTHGVLYRELSAVNAVVHVHSPDLWRSGTRLGLSSTSAEIPYGSPEMAAAVSSLSRKLWQQHSTIVFTMRGHEDGVIAAGNSMQDCARVLTRLLHSARSISSDAIAEQSGRVKL